MCSRYELLTAFEDLQISLQKSLPSAFEKHYEEQPLIRPADPVLVLREEYGKQTSSLMLWGLLAEWSKDPINALRPFNARAETVSSKPSFKAAWRHRRCLIPASGFFEKGQRIRKATYKPFWMAGLWNRWLGVDGSEIESCVIITTKPNSLVKPLHNRMPVVIPEGLEDLWMTSTDGVGLRELGLLLRGWDPQNWLVEPMDKKRSINSQMSLF